MSEDNRMITVECSPVVPVIHVTDHCGPKGDLVMLNLYEKTRFLYPAEAIALADALLKAAVRTVRIKRGGAVA